MIENHRSISSKGLVCRQNRSQRKFCMLYNIIQIQMYENNRKQRAPKQSSCIKEAQDGHV